MIGSLPYSHQPASGVYHGPNRCSPHATVLLNTEPLLFHLSTQAQIFQGVPSHQPLPSNVCVSCSSVACLEKHICTHMNVYEYIYIYTYMIVSIAARVLFVKCSGYIQIE
jgi:hypothetical protein